MVDLDLNSLQSWPSGRVGVVAIVGRPNVGKSTFLNSVLNFRLCAVSSKPQTTRKNWRGVLSDDSSQIIFVDTPGAHVGKTVLGEFMLDNVMDSLRDADVILCLTDPSRSCGDEDQLVAERIGSLNKPVLLLLNKSDITTEEERAETTTFYQEYLEGDVFEISAAENSNLDSVLSAIRERLPEGPFFYDPEEITDAFMRDIAAEQIREAALELLQKEVPHALAIEINKWDEGPKKTTIKATIHVERDSQKRIVVGQNGSMIAAIRRNAVQSLVELCDGRINLNLYVKVSKDWRNRKNFLRNLGLVDNE